MQHDSVTMNSVGAGQHGSADDGSTWAGGIATLLRVFCTMETSVTKCDNTVEMRESARGGAAVPGRCMIHAV